MAFMDNMRDRLTQASQSTVQKAKGLSELAKLNSMISNSEKQISDLYGKIGHEVYCVYRNAHCLRLLNLFSKLLIFINLLKIAKHRL